MATRVGSVCDKVRPGGGQVLSEAVATFGLILVIRLASRLAPAATAALVALYNLRGDRPGVRPGVPARAGGWNSPGGFCGELDPAEGTTDPLTLADGKRRPERLPRN